MTPGPPALPRRLEARQPGQAPHGLGLLRGGLELTHITYDGLWYRDPVPTYAEHMIADEFEEHQARTDRPVVTAREAQEVWDNGFVPRRNARGSGDTRLLIGRTDGGRRVTLVSRSLGDGRWFTYTGWDTKEADLA